MTPHIDPAEAGLPSTGNLLKDLGFGVEEPIGSVDPADRPGAMQDKISRDVPGLGLVEFEYSPAGWTAKNGERRVQDWRAYFFTPTGGKRTRLPSVTTWLSAVLPKDLSRYGETHGAIGAHLLHQRGELTVEHTEEDAVERVRMFKLGVEAATNRAASRGIDVHACLEHYMRHGSLPSVPLELAGYVRGLQDWIRDFDPEPEEVELLVADPDRGYAGRLDARATVRSAALPIRARRVLDLKTSPKLSIWPSAHAQTRAYALADAKCGGPETDTPLIVVVDAEGRYEAVDCACSTEQLDDALAWYRSLKPLEAACASRHRKLRAA